MQVRALVPVGAFLALGLAACGGGEVQRVMRPSEPAPASQQLTGTWQSTGDDDVVVKAAGAQAPSVPEFLLASCKEREQSLSEAERRQCSEIVKAQNLK